MRFDDKAGSYHDKADIQKIAADWCSEWIEKDCRGLRGLELGSGTGLFTKHLSMGSFAQFRATDISESMLDEGKRRLPHLDWKKEDAWNLNTKPIDRLYACSLLQWAPDPIAVFRKWRKSLVNGGRLLVCLFVEESLKEFEGNGNRFAAVQWRGCDEWFNAMKQGGFEVLRSETRIDKIEYSSAREALRSLHDIGAISRNRMKATELRRFLTEISSRLPMPFEVTWKSLRVECVVK